MHEDVEDVDPNKIGIEVFEQSLGHQHRLPDNAFLNYGIAVARG